MNRYSILQKEKRCYVCGNTNVHIHEVYFGKNRKKSIRDGCCVYLCPSHHNMSIKGVHFDHILDLMLKAKMQEVWMEHYNKTKEDFIKEYGRSYL